MDIPREIVANLIRATTDVFETMVLKRIDLIDPAKEIPPRAGSQVAATVGFTGHRCGAVVFHAGADVAREIAGALLAMPAAEVNGEMADAIGEVTNMIAGTLRTRMASLEPAWAIAVPTVTIGSDFVTRYATDAARVLCAFDMEGQGIQVELILNRQ
ncbi:MAG: chemotaxis protein CheX [Acidobacteria bacterium]|nr:chemotaxis protein CheX [Acidobacteriota bacterium]